ncbi:MAG: hypothetical protein ACK4VW_05385 [Anaerolineales bacterium]
MNNGFLVPLVLFLGIFIALLVGYFIGRMEKGSSSSSASAPSSPALLRLFLDAEQRPNLEVDGILLTQPLTTEQRKRLIALLNLIRPWLESSASKGASVPAAPQTSPPPSPSPRSSIPAKIPPSPAKKIGSPEKPPEAVSIVPQIDAILQEILQRNGVQRAIHLSEGADGNVQVIVDLKLYGSIEEVPDREIQHLIRQAVAEWEKR